MQKVLLIDATSLAFRSYYAFIRRPLINSKGINTSGPFAFINSIEKLKNEIGPSHILAVFDAPHKTFRHELYKEYKAQRPKPPDELKTQIQYIKGLLDAYLIKFLEIEGVEADDVIASFVKKYSRDDVEIYISTQDKDLFQLVGDNVYVVQGISSHLEMFDRNKVILKFGVPPEKIADFLALVGDSIDNIPGVKGIGNKTGIELLKRYESIEDIYAHIDEIDGKIREKLIKYKDDCFFSKKLVLLRDDVNIDIDLNEIRRREPERKKLAKILKFFEFEKLLKTLAKEEFIPEFSKSQSFPFNAIDGVSVDVHDDTVFAILNDGKRQNVPLRSAKALLENSGVPKYVFDYKMQFRKLYEKDIVLRGVTFDLPLALYLIEPERGNYSLDRIFMEEFLAKPAKNEIDRAKQRVFLVHTLKEEYEKKLSEMHLLDLYKDIELPLARILALMEHHGTLIDTEYLHKLKNDIDEDLDKLKRKLYEIAGKEVNLNSPKQLSKVLFEELKLPVIKKTKTGYSTDQETLEKLKQKHEFVRLLLDYRELFKIKSTYIEPFFKLVDKEHRVHPTFNQMHTATGRLSCSNPNLQNLPIRSDIGKKIRKVVIAPDGYLIASFDYSQIELRITAHLSQDETLRKAFLEDADIHTQTASLIFQKPPNEISAFERRIAKTVNFGIIYGISPYGLSKQLSISQEEAQGIIYNFFAIYPGVNEWIMKVLKDTEEKGYTKTIFGRMRRIPELKSQNKNIREQGKRLAINTPVQGSAADIIKKAMIDVENFIESEHLDAYMILQVHDELVFEVKEDIIEYFTQRVKVIMEHTTRLEVPLKVDFGYGKDWLTAHQ